MDSGWLLADGEAVASALRVRTPWDRHRAAKSARRGETAAVLRAPTILLGPLDVIVVGGGRHAWSNRTTSPAILATVGVGIGTEPS